MKDCEKKLKRIEEEHDKKMDEIMHKHTISCTWTTCDDGTHMPTENGKYLIVDTDGDYQIVDFFKNGSVITSHNRKDFHVDVIADQDGFYFFSHVDDGCPYLIDSVLGYIKISDINIYKVGEKNV